MPPNYFTPDLIIMGFPKCGTTSLVRILDDAVGLCCATVKEPHFFIPTHPMSTASDGEVAYAQLFAHAQTGDICFEASTWYAYDRTAIKSVLARNPATKFILCLRDPTAMVLSLHGHALRQGYEDITDPVAAWHAQDGTGAQLQRAVTLPRSDVRQYRYLSALGQHFADRVEDIPIDQLFVYFLEDIQKNEQLVLSRLATFLDRPGLAYQTVPKDNPSRLYRARWLMKLNMQFHTSGVFRVMKQGLKQVGLKSVIRRILYKSLVRNDDTILRFHQEITAHSQEQIQKIIDVAEQIGEKELVQQAHNINHIWQQRIANTSLPPEFRT